MVKIRLKRQGRKKRPFYRIVVTDIRNRRDGAPLAELGFYDPIAKTLKLNKSLASEWMRKGAMPTPTAQRLIQMAPESGELLNLPQRERKVVAPPPPPPVVEEPKQEEVVQEEVKAEEPPAEEAPAADAAPEAEAPAAE